MKKLLFYLVLMIFGITGIAGATRMCHPPACPEDWDFKIWHDVDYIGEELKKGDPVSFSFDLTPYYNPAFDVINTAWMAFYFKGSADNWFVGKYDFDGGGVQWEIGHTNFYGRTLELERLWGDPLNTLRTTGMLSGEFTAWWKDDCDWLNLKKAYLFAKGCDNPVPEPATLLLLGSGLVAFAGIGRKKIFKKKKK
jgi:hypothetical protein